MTEYIKGEKVSPIRCTEIKKSLINQFTDSNKQAPLIWLKLNQKPNRITPEEAMKIKFPQEEVLFYLERSSKMFKTNITDIQTYIKKLDPWIELDAYIFDESLSWLAIITHEDDWLTIGL